MRHLLGALLALASSVPALAAEAVLVKDIKTAVTGGPAIPGFLFESATLGQRLLFAADDGFLGVELWRTDGTAAGTALVADLCPGRCAGAPERFATAGGVAYFLARDPSQGRELWRSDGTAAGTFPLADVLPGAGDGEYAFLARLGQRLIFATPSGEDAWTLWHSDGTAAGTRPFVTLTGIVGTFQRPAVAGGVLVFAHLTEDEGFELWRTDGTAAGTGPLRSLQPGIASSVDGLFRPTAAGGRLYFAAFEEAAGVEPWTTDGTPAGTRRLADLMPGPASSDPAAFVVRDRTVVFSAHAEATGRELWATDGTAAGTRLLADLAPGPGSSFPAILAAARGQVLFTADDGLHGLEPYVVRNDGTVQSLGDLWPGVLGSTAGTLPSAALAGRFYFAADNGRAGRELWTTDGTAAGTRLLKSLSPGSKSTFFGVLVQLGDRLVFAFSPQGQAARARLGVSRGTPETTMKIADIHAGLRSSDPQSLAALPGRVVFAADDGVHGQELWTSTGRRAGTALLADLETDPFAFHPATAQLTASGGRLFFLTGFGKDLWVSRGVPGDPVPLLQERRLLHGLTGPVGQQPLLFFDSTFGDGKLALELWRSGGAAATTERVATVVEEPREVDNESSFFAVTSGPGVRTYFVAHFTLDFTDRASGLWTTDGTAEGTRELVADPCGGCTAVREIHVAPASGRLFYLTRDDRDRPGKTEIWTSDGTPAGTRRLLQSVDFDGPIFRIRDLVVSGGRAYFVAADADRGEELWTSDGTPEGTRPVEDLRPGPHSSGPSELTRLCGGRLAFAADDGVHGREPWVTDGTAAGTRLVADVRAGRRGSHAQAFAVIDGMLVFAADDGRHGLEPWRSNFTAAGTALLADVAPGKLSSSPREFTATGIWVLFNAGRPAVGYELFHLPRAALGAP